MQNKIIYFDFDRTLIDTDALKVEQAERVAKITQLTVAQVQEGMKQYIASIDNHLNFDIGEYAAFLARQFDVNPSDVAKIYLTDCNYIANYLFPESLEVLEKLREAGFALGIFSGAVPGHQKVKIESTGVLEFIPWDSVIISPQKLQNAVVSKVPEGATIIDDDPNVIQYLVDNHPLITPIWCNRKTNETMPQVRTIKNLRELLS